MTVRLDPASQARFDAERRRLFPPARNHIPAHVTLFHHLPGAEAAVIGEALARCARQPAPAFRATGVRFLGAGTAYELEMPDVAALRRQLAAAWRAWLTPQDRQSWRPHVTVQNKADPAEARITHAGLAAGFTAFGGRVAGLALWEYLGGPWRTAGEFDFEPKT